MLRQDDRDRPGARTATGADMDGQALDGYTRRLQRIVRERQPGGPEEASQMPPEPSSQKAASLSPELVGPASAVPGEGQLYQCTDCDMIVRETDPYCPHCGAIFADGPLSTGDTAAEADERPERPEPQGREEPVRPGKFDVFGMMDTKGRARELLYQEAVRSFAGSARLLEEIEHLISDVSSLGTDTSKARRLMSSAWEACREGNWNLVSALARQTEEMMAPSIPTLVRSELARAREHLAEAKAAGVDISRYLLRMKAAMHSLKAGDDDEALRTTKELVDLLREDSVIWRED